MTVSTTNTSVSYFGNGSTLNFPFLFMVYQASELIVTSFDATSLSDIAVISQSNYSIAGLGSESGGSITFTSGAPTTGIRIDRVVPLIQPLQLLNEAGFFPETLMQQLDETVMQIQQLQNEVNHAVVFQPSETGLILPSVSARKGLFWQFDPTTGALTFVSGTGTTTDANSVTISYTNGITETVAKSLARFVFIEQYGAIPNDPSKAVINVLAARAALTALGAGTLLSGPGTFYFDDTTLGATGISIPSSVTIRAIRGATIWKNINQASTNPILYSSGTSDVNITEITLQGKALFNSVTRGSVKNCNLLGALSSQIQYSEVALGIASAFASPTFNDGLGGSLSGSDFTHVLAGSVLTLTHTTGTLGSTREYRNIQSAQIAINPTNRYVISFSPGFYSGAGCSCPQILLFNSSGAPLSAGQGFYPYSGAAIDNVFVPQNPSQNDYITALITGASFIAFQVGTYRDYPVPVGLVASFDISKINVYQVVNDLAAWPLNTSPGDLGQIFLSSCTDFDITDNDFYMINQCCAKLVNSIGCNVSGNRGRYILQGFTDDTGTNNTICENSLDLRVKTVGGSLIGSRAYRLRGIGGTGPQGGNYSNNVILGASWAIEVLPNNGGYRNTANNNLIEAEFCGASIGSGHWVSHDNRIYLASDGFIGIEHPGASSPAYEYANSEDNYIYWADFAGYLGFGYSASVFQSIRIRGGYIRAPYLAQSAGSAIGARFELSEVDGEYMAQAFLGRDGADEFVHFGKITPYTNTGYPYGTVTSSYMFDISVTASTVVVKVGFDFGTNATSGYAIVQGSADVTLEFKQARMSSTVTSYYIQISFPAVVALYRLFDCDFINPPAGTTANQWCSFTGTYVTGTHIIMSNNKWAGAALSVPSGAYTRSAILGDPAILAYDVNRAVGTIAAGATFTQTISLNGASPVSMSFTLTPYGNSPTLWGLITQVASTADDSVTYKVTNPSASPIVVGTATLVIRGTCYS